MFAAWLFIFVPLLLFVIAFVIETFLSIKRLKNNKREGSYVSATWEVTHTFLVVAVAMFVSLFSDYLTDIARVSLVGFIIVTIFAGIRGSAYLYIFYIRNPNKRSMRNWIDTLFAFAHLGMVVGLFVLLARLIPEMMRLNPQPNTDFIPWMIPGLILVISLCALPLVSIYNTKK